VARSSTSGPDRRPARWLGSTYRLQLRPGDLDWAAGLLGYLSRLGVETVYCSPIARAVPGSTHGYDVSDPGEVDPALGGFAAWERFAAEADRLGLGILVDHVPNHQAASEHNPAFADVLRRGPASRSAPVFDVDWAALEGRILLPILARPFDEALDADEIAIDVASPDDAAGLVVGEPVAVVADRRLPLAPGSWSDLAGSPAELAKGMRRPGPANRRRLAELLERQYWRLAWWRTAPADINYRRFFDIDGLIGVRVEDPVVFERTHWLLERLAASPAFAGVRVDHPDGLADPARYLERLQALLERATRRRAERPVVVVEKILAHDERLRDDWAADGTTGYELAAKVNALFLDAEGLRSLGQETPDFAELSAEGRREALARLFPGETERLARRLAHLARSTTTGHDVTSPDVAWALRALLCALDVYRPYVSARAAPAEEDRAVLHRAVEVALERVAAGKGEPPPPSAPGARLDPRGLLEDVASLLLDPPEGLQRGTDGARPWGALVARFGQLASATAAKGVEDTALYRLARGLATADVGADPSSLPESSATLVTWAAQRHRWGPASLNALSTHDAKRSGDARARLAVLTEMAGEWHTIEARLNRRLRPPDPAFAAQCYVQAVAIWPTESLLGTPSDDPRRLELCSRLQGWATKAAREAKVATSWTDPDLAWEGRIADFLARLLTDDAGEPFVAELDRVSRRIGAAGAANSLASVVLASCLPGVPDIYQGTETWSPLLVDPDNRRPVDFSALDELVERASAAAPEHLAEDWQSGLVKVRLTSTLAHLRRRARRLFAEGDVLSLRVGGERAEHVVAFARRLGDTWALVVVPRCTLHLAPPGRLPVGRRAFGDTWVTLPPGAPGRLVDALSGAELHPVRRRLQVAEVLHVLPVAVALGGRSGSGPRRQ